MKAGQWTDDTSLAMCLAESLVERRGFDARDQLARYLKWYRDGHWSSRGRCFDIGGTTRAALARFEETGEAECGLTDELSAGNGSLMRLAPVGLFYSGDYEAAQRYGGESSRTTHAAAACVDACRFYATLIAGAANGVAKEELLGRDADTTGAVYGQLAGAYYGERGIPEEWRALLWRGEEIARMAERLMETGGD